MEQDELFEKAKQQMEKSWETHRQAFGSLLEDAYEEDQQARVWLTHALNLISRRQCADGRNILQQDLQSRCQNDEDTAAWRFFMGLSYEMEGNRQQMLHWYSLCCQLEHSSYLPHLKLAKAYHADAFYDPALHHYKKGIECALQEAEPDRLILGSAYTNLTTCLTMMHRFDEADQAWKTAQTYILQPAAFAAGAMLEAAKGNGEGVNRLLKVLQEKYPSWAEKTLPAIRQVMAGNHPHFHKMPITDTQISVFWQWFRDNQAGIIRADRQVLQTMNRQLQVIMPFLRRDVRFRVERDGQKRRVSFCDFYALGVHYGYGAILQACPQDLWEHWSFTIIH